MVRVSFFGSIRSITHENETEVPAPATMRDLLSLLSSAYGVNFAPGDEFDGWTVSDTETGGVSVMIVLLNGRHIQHAGGADAPLSEGDHVAIFPLVGGG